MVVKFAMRGNTLICKAVQKAYRAGVIASLILSSRVISDRE